jgi:hypothetical protein
MGGNTGSCGITTWKFTQILIHDFNMRSIEGDSPSSLFS